VIRDSLVRYLRKGNGSAGQQFVKGLLVRPSQPAEVVMLFYICGFEYFLIFQPRDSTLAKKAAFHCEKVALVT
jgi:hypothetical protein